MYIEGFSFMVSNHGELLWNKGVGTALGFAAIEEYLKTIPEPPEFSDDIVEKFPRLVLVDHRLVKKLGFLEAARVLGIRRFHEVVDLSEDPMAQQELPAQDEDFVTWLASMPDDEVYWMRAQDGTGRFHEKMKVSTRVPLIRARFEKNEAGLTAEEGLFLVVNMGGLPSCYHADIGMYSSFDLLLPGTYRKGDPESCVLIRQYDDLVIDFFWSHLCDDEDYDACWGWATKVIM